MKATCDYCGKEMFKKTGHYNRAMKLGAGIYCDRKCAGLGRRIDETPEQKKIYKQWYDLFIRASLTDDERDIRTLQALVLFHLDYRNNPEKYKDRRRRKMPAHIEYCRQPEYRKKKKAYDEVHRAKKFYGEYWEAAIVLKKLEKEIPTRVADKENKLYNKSTTKRKRLWQKVLKQTSSLQPKI
jgi:ssDNA-binding Zn-finger/Zn-ribbon topoisomerase 1